MTTYKILAYSPLHYGSEYLSEAIQAIYPCVDKIILLYSEKPSYGFGTSIENPDSREKLKAIAALYNKCQWVEVNPCHEGNHRAQIGNFTQGYDGLLAFDADEVYDTEDLRQMIQTCMNSKSYRFGIDGYINFWRSFDWVCYDGFRPIRFFNLHNDSNQKGNEDAKCKIYHFGCAQSMAIMQYKLLIHGHKSEIRPDWLNSVYRHWRPGIKINKGLHLVSHDLWDAIPYDKTNLPELLKSHPNYNKTMI
jgi:hypothetical protein